MNYIDIIENNNGIELELTEEGRQDLLANEILYIEGQDGFGCELDNLEFTNKLFEDKPIHVFESQTHDLFLENENQEMYVNQDRENFLQGLVIYGKAFFKRLGLS